MFSLSADHLLDHEHAIPNFVPVLIQRALDFLLLGKNDEGIPLLTQAYAQLVPDKTHLAGVLEEVINICVRYNQAHEALLTACRDYTKAELERRAQLSILADAFAVFNQEDAACPPQPVTQPIPIRLPERMRSSPFLSDRSSRQDNPLPALSITCFGEFAVYRNGLLLELCHSRGGQAILRYLVAQRDYRATADILMEVLWPEEEPNVARRRLQVAISSLRCSLNEGYDCHPGGGYILCKNQLYQINPLVRLQTDVGEFVRLYQEGQRANRSQMFASYEQACRLYRGPFLVEDVYVDWSMRRREQLSKMYLMMCGILSKHCFEAGQYEDAAHWASAMLDENRCDEDAHLQLMRAYAALGRRGDALSQYHLCEQILMEELSVAPMPETVQVYQTILLGQMSFTSPER